MLRRKTPKDRKLLHPNGHNFLIIFNETDIKESWHQRQGLILSHREAEKIFLALHLISLNVLY